jgi:hypothetical protein
MKENQQQLDTLLRQFVNEPAAREMAEDIRHMDNLLSSLASHKISQQTLSSVKTRVRQRLAEKHSNPVRWRMRLKLISAAAVILLVAGVAFFITPRQTEISPPSPIVSYTWNDGAESENDPVDSLLTRIEMAAGQLDSVHGQTSSWFEEDNSLTIEIQDAQTLVADTDYWKG